MAARSKGDDEEKRISKKEIQKYFDTSIQNGMFYIVDRGTHNLVMQGRIIMRADPILTMDYVSNICRQLVKYRNDAVKSIKGQAGN